MEYKIYETDNCTVKLECGSSYYGFGDLIKLSHYWKATHRREAYVTSLCGICESPKEMEDTFHLLKEMIEGKVGYDYFLAKKEVEAYIKALPQTH